ncbi:MAG TPA: hypothetical protein PLY93_02625 [Turneriella sp.]|nr:hypothetical protein [Turneriella sp.]
MSVDDLNKNIEARTATPQKRAQELIREFVEFSEKYSAQIPLAIPKGTLKTIDHYRDTYFKYLKDSEFKSNICYMLQLIEYQLWQYKLFKPQYSLENALFFQLLITQGIVIEAVVFALIADPLVTSDKLDRSKGSTNDEYSLLLNLIRRRTFSSHVQQLAAMEILSEPLREKLDTFRSEIRNLVHLQNWDGRLYRQITLVEYTKHLHEFDVLLKELNAQVTAVHTLDVLLQYYQLDGRSIKGIVKFYNRNSRRGQIDAKSVHDYIPFFYEDSFGDWLPQKNDVVFFTLALNEHGVRAIQVKPNR